MTSRLDDFPHARRPSRLRRLKEVPVLPSVLTLGNLFFGFLAMAKVADALAKAQPGATFASVVNYFELAAILVFVAMVFDALDGRVARMTGQATPFGAQLDSMADMVTFGVAPAFLAKVLVDWHAQTDSSSRLLPLHPKLFYAAAAVYVVGAALRLARFNVETGVDEDEHREFKGLPSPAAAAVIASLVALFCTRNDPSAELGHWLLAPYHFDWIVIAMPFVLVTIGVLMVSRVPFPHALHALLRGRHSLPVVAGLVIVIIVAAIEWQLALVVCSLLYVLSGLVLGCFRVVARRRDDDDDELPELPKHGDVGRN
ncbi:MAG: CDP-alcohol phosphatidyltransferase family protein [Planctomycetota bacterium]